MTIHITIPGNIRSKKNSKRVFCRGKYPVVLPSKPYMQWEKQAQQAARDQFHGAIIDGPVWVQVVAYCKGVLPDLSGMLESVGDCLEGVIWANDKQIVSWDGSRVIRDKAHQRTEIIITEV
jgi:Holliday junction resolvase RusA-like endonuclease